MNRDSVVLSPAKINIHLDIKNRRNDGFHDIVSLFHKVDLCDEITIRSLKNEDTCRILGDFDCPEQDNLIMKAAIAFLDRAKLIKGYEFRVVKRIPPGAGLGGGSGNAAAVLEFLNRINGNPLEFNDLNQIGESLGSDIPFFLGGSAALVTGRGEKLKSLSALNDKELVLVVPEIMISTRFAYGLFDMEGRVRTELDAAGVENAYNCSCCSEWPFFNSFWEPVSKRYPVLLEVDTQLREEKAEFVSLSGTGSAVFGIFSVDEYAQKAYKRLKKQFKQVWKIKLLAK